MRLFFGHLLVVNLIGFLMFGTDKARARRGMWRIPERTLFAAAVLGGSVGCLAGMYLFRHKTRHLSFVIGLPVILAVQCVVLSFLFF